MIALSCHQNTSFMDFSDSENKMKDLDAEVKSLGEMIKMKDQDILQQQIQMSREKAEQLADKEFPTELNETPWIHYLNERCNREAADTKKYSRGKQNAVPTTKFLPLRISCEKIGVRPGNYPLQDRTSKQKSKALFLANFNGRFCGERLQKGLMENFAPCTISNQVLK